MGVGVESVDFFGCGGVLWSFVVVVVYGRSVGWMLWGGVCRVLRWGVC